MLAGIIGLDGMGGKNSVRTMFRNHPGISGKARTSVVFREASSRRELYQKRGQERGTAPACRENGKRYEETYGKKSKKKPEVNICRQERTEIKMGLDGPPQI